MDRKFYLDLAASGLRMPVGTDLVLHEHGDAQAILLDGNRLGQVIEESANRWRTPIALALMDLTLEKNLILDRLGVPSAQWDSFHFTAAPDEQLIDRATVQRAGHITPRLKANLEAMTHVSRQTKLKAVGMAIGPFSLMTKLLADPITPVYMAGTGVTAAEDPEVAMVEATLDLATRIILESVASQAKAGVAGVMIAEPAASNAYFSPKQLAGGTDIYQRYVMAPNRRIAARCAELGMDHLFHCCGELTEQIVRDLGSLRPVLLSLGSSRTLWDDAALVPKDVVLFGNLPTKKFYSDQLVSDQDVARLSSQLLQKMKSASHPFILGSECDVLSVPGVEATIKRKVGVMLQCKCS